MWNNSWCPENIHTAHSKTPSKNLSYFLLMLHVIYMRERSYITGESHILSLSVVLLWLWPSFDNAGIVSQILLKTVDYIHNVCSSVHRKGKQFPGGWKENNGEMPKETICEYELSRLNRCACTANEYTMTWLKISQFSFNRIERVK